MRLQFGIIVREGYTKLGRARGVTDEVTDVGGIGPLIGAHGGVGCALECDLGWVGWFERAKDKPAKVGERLSGVEEDDQREFMVLRVVVGYLGEG